MKRKETKTEKKKKQLSTISPFSAALETVAMVIWVTTKKMKKKETQIEKKKKKKTKEKPPSPLLSTSELPLKL